MHREAAVHMRDAFDDLLENVLDLLQFKLQPVGHQPEQVMLEVVEHQNDTATTALPSLIHDVFKGDNRIVVQPAQVRDLPIVVDAKLVSQPRSRRSSTKFV